MTHDPHAAPDVTAARTAIEQGAWTDAVTALEAAGIGTPESAGSPTAETPEILELLAAATYGAGQFERCVAAWERRHEVCSNACDADEAARSAAMVGMYLMMDTGLMAPVRGWLARADRHVADRPDSPAHAIIAMTRTYERFMCGDMAAARIQSSRAIELGERLGVDPAVVIGRVCAARVTIFEGDIDGGLAQLDEVGALLMSGTVDPLTTGMMYCELICAAQGLALHQRANEWTDVMDHWRQGAAIGGISGRCRVHKAEMLRMTGPCDAAEQEALGACDELRPWMRREFGWPLAELGMIRLRMGDLAGAEEALVAAHQHAWSPHPGMALLRLEQGDVAAAQALIREAIEHPVDIPSKERPPFGDLRLAPLYDAEATIASVAHDVDTAEAATTRLEEIAATYGSPSLRASADVARARALLLTGGEHAIAAAVDAASRGMMTWMDVGAPFEAATARVVLGHAHAAAGRHDTARLEWGAAATAFDDFGAHRAAEHARALVDDSACATPSPAATASRTGPVATSTDPARRRGVFRVVGDQRMIDFAGTATTVRDLKGFRYLARLLADPDREFHVLDLVAVEQGTLPTGGDAAVGPAGFDGESYDDAGLGDTEGLGLPQLDEQAKRAYQRRLEDVDDDIEEARRLNDIGRLELAERDRDYLVAELSRAVGLGGRLRSSGSDAERARTAVTRSLRYSLGKLAEHHEALAHHLERSIRTGTYCSYAPDSSAAVDWDT